MTTQNLNYNSIEWFRIIFTVPYVNKRELDLVDVTLIFTKNTGS